jgi:hypothetical protein
MQINSLESEWTSAQNIKPRRETVTLAIGFASPHTILKKTWKRRAASLFWAKAKHCMRQRSHSTHADVFA